MRWFREGDAPACPTHLPSAHPPVSQLVYEGCCQALCGGVVSRQHHVGKHTQGGAADLGGSWGWGVGLERGEGTGLRGGTERIEGVERESREDGPC